MKVLPEIWRELDSVWLGAGPVPEILHRMLIGLAWLVRFKTIPSLLPFAGLFHFVINILRWGEHRGGMFVSVEGTCQSGERIERSWHLLAESGDGPFIPSMAIAAIILHMLAGKKPSVGARAATHELEVADYEAIFKSRTIYTGERESKSDADAPLYKRLLGAAWDALPAPLAALHNVTTFEQRAEGVARVERGKNLIGRWIATLFGFPKAGENVPVKVSFQRKDGGELWIRDFGGRKFSSFQSEGSGHWERLLVEQFGPTTFAMALVTEQDKLRLVLRHWRFFGIPLPLFLVPTEDSYEYVADGLFCFHVEIKYWLTGLIVRYEGRLSLV